METMVSSDNLYSRTLDALDEAGNTAVTLSQGGTSGKMDLEGGQAYAESFFE